MSTTQRNQEGSSSPNVISRKSSAHSPYAHPALRSCDQFTGTVQQLSQASNSSGSGSSNGSENGELNAHLTQPTVAPPSHSGVQRTNNSATKTAPPPPSYVQATVHATREWAATPPSEHDQHVTPPHTPELDSSAQSTYSANQSTTTVYHNQSSSNTYNNNSVNVAPQGAYHSALFGQCEWIQPPPVPLVDQPTPAFPCYRLFLGQIRFETTPAEVKWIVEYVTGVQALKVESRGIGCFLAYFQTYEDMINTQQLHKRVLFDHTGIWFARTDEQSFAMQDYVRQALGRIGRGFRLPKDMMVVEEEKLQRALPIPSAPPQYGGSAPAASSPSATQHTGHHGHQLQSYSSFSGAPARGGGNSRFHQQQYNQQHGGNQQAAGNQAPFPSHHYTHHSTRPNQQSQYNPNQQQQQQYNQQQLGSEGYSQIPDYQQGY